MVGGLIVVSSVFADQNRPVGVLAHGERPVPTNGLPRLKTGPGAWPVRPVPFWNGPEGRARRDAAPSLALGTRLWSGADFEDEVERGLGGPTEPGVAGLFEHFS
jgi:hypothetical protein